MKKSRSSLPKNEHETSHKLRYVMWYVCEGF